MENKNYDFGNRFANYLLLLGASLSLSCNINFLYVWQNNIYSNFFYMVLTCAVLLALPCFFKKAAKIAAASCVIILAGGAAFFLLKYGSVTLSIINAVITGNFVLKQSDLFISLTLCVVSALCCLLIYFSSKTRISLLLTTVAGIALVFLLAAEKYGYSMPAFLVFIGCCAVIYIRRVYNLTDSIDKADQKGILTAVVAVFCILSLILSQVSYSALSYSLQGQNKLTLYDIPGKIYDLMPFKPLKSGFGDYNPSRPLGGNISYDDSPVFDVYSDGPFYLKGRIYDKYTGRNWQATAVTGNNSIYSKSFFNMPLAWYNFSFSFLNLHHMTVLIKSPEQHYLFVSQNMINASEGLYKNQLKNSYPDLKLKTPLKSGSTYSFYYFSLNENTIKREYNYIVRNNFFKGMLKNIEPFSKEVRAAYMGTENITPRTSELAKKITKGCKTEFEKAGAIKAWLQKNCTYSLTPNETIFPHDFCDYFLFVSHSGYCEHFATAMTLLLRASGVPARYVEGYAAPDANANRNNATDNYAISNYAVTNRQAHAWVEYYSNLWGFITADPTPSTALPGVSENKGLGTGAGKNASSPSSSSASSSSSRVSSRMSSKSVLSSAVSSSNSSAKKSPAAGGQTNHGQNYAYFAAILGVAALFLIIYGGKALLRRLWYRYASRLPANVQAVKLYGSILRTLSHLGFEYKSCMTPEEFADTVREKIEFGTPDFDCITKIYLAARFGGSEIKKEDIKDIRKFYLALFENCRKTVGTAAFILKYPLL